MAPAPALFNFFFLDGSTIVLQATCVTLDFALSLILRAPLVTESCQLLLHAVSRTCLLLCIPLLL